MTRFATILQSLVERVPGALGAAFVDAEGEAVGAFALDPALEVELSGAQWGVVWSAIQRWLARAELDQAGELLVDGERRTVLVRGVADRYTVVLTARRGAHLATAFRELDRVIGDLRAEMQ